MAKLGDFTFSIDTAAFQEWSRKKDYAWAKNHRLGKGPARQFLGVEDDLLTLPGVIYPHYKGGLKQIVKMREMADKGEPLLLIYAEESLGQVLGKWVILSVEEKRTIFERNGVPRKIEFSLSLAKYGEDK